MKIILCDTNIQMCMEWSVQTQTPARTGDLFQVPSDAVVSPANSFGFMDGGVDYRISKFLGWHVQERLQKIIREEYDGELLVGQAVAVPTDHEVFKYVISAPTMRVPLVINDFIDVYLAARAATRVALKLNLQKLTFTGMGTGVGQVAPWKAVQMMKRGIEHAISPPPFPTSWRQAQSDHFS